jgi:hypothetical protein
MPNLEEALSIKSQVDVVLLPVSESISAIVTPTNEISVLVLDAGSIPEVMGSVVEFQFMGKSLTMPLVGYKSIQEYDGEEIIAPTVYFDVEIDAVKEDGTVEKKLAKQVEFYLKPNETDMEMSIRVNLGGNFLKASGLVLINELPSEDTDQVSDSSTDADYMDFDLFENKSNKGSNFDMLVEHIVKEHISIDELVAAVIKRKSIS